MPGIHEEESGPDPHAVDRIQPAEGRSGNRRASAIRNALLNWVGFGTEIVVAFLLTPYLVNRLGTTTYGVWFLIGSLAGYFGMLDFGLGSSIGRFVAFYRGQGDHDGVLRVIATSAAILTTIGACAFLLAFLSSYGLHLLFDIPEVDLPHARAALMIVGANLGLTFFFTTFDSALWGYERFDLKNLVDVLTTIVRALLTVVLISRGLGLEGLAWSTLTVMVIGGMAKLVLCRAVLQPFHLAWGMVGISTFRELAPFGFWQFLLSSSRIARLNLYPVLIGTSLGPAIVTPFSLAARLVGYAGLAITTSVNVVAPTLVAFAGQEDSLRQRAMMMTAGRICSAFALYAVSALVVFGRPFLCAWIGADLSWAWVVIAVLAAGEWLPMVVHPFNLAVFASARQREVAWRGVAECILGLALGVVLGTYWGLTGFAVAFGVAATWFRGVFMLRYAGPLLNIRTADYIQQAVLPIVARGIVPVLMLVAASNWREPATWEQLIAHAAGFTVVFAVFVGPCLGRVDPIPPRRVFRMLAALIRTT